MHSSCFRTDGFVIRRSKALSETLIPWHRSALQINSTATMAPQRSNIDPVLIAIIVYVPLLVCGMVCGTVLQIAQRAAGVGIATRITCDVALMLGGAATSILFRIRKRGVGLLRDFETVDVVVLIGELLVVTGAVAMTEGALLNTLLSLKDMAFPAT